LLTLLFMQILLPSTQADDQAVDIFSTKGAMAVAWRISGLSGAHVKIEGLGSKSGSATTALFYVDADSLSTLDWIVATEEAGFASAAHAGAGPIVKLDAGSGDIVCLALYGFACGGGRATLEYSFDAPGAVYAIALVGIDDGDSQLAVYGTGFSIEKRILALPVFLQAKDFEGVAVASAHATAGFGAEAILQAERQTTHWGHVYGSFAEDSLIALTNMSYQRPDATFSGSSSYLIENGPPGSYTYHVEQDIATGIFFPVQVLAASFDLEG
jgi:hypothetical protein